MSLLVVGSVALDTIETDHGAERDILGGSATYFSLAASHFLPVRLVAVVGEDFSIEHRAFLQAHQVDLKGLQISSGKTFRWVGSYTGDMNEAITHDTQLNVFENFKPELPDEYRDSEYVFLGNIDPELQLDVLKQVNNPKFVALDTMNFWIDGKNDALRKVIENVDMLVINQAEILQLSNESNMPRAVEEIIKWGPKAIIIKRGEYGCALFSQNEWFALPGYCEANVVDPTGAGDSFAGGLMGSIAASGDTGVDVLKRSVVYGSVVASYNITSFGPWKLAKLNHEIIQERFNAFKTLVSF